MIEADTIINSLIKVKADKYDLVVLNGGEPTIHPEFYTLLKKIQNEIPSEIAVYSNGISLATSKLPQNNDTFFVIPIHGSEIQHDRIAQTKGSFKRTLSNLCDLEANIHRYRIKFIVNDMMISTNFSFNDFLAEYKLNPEEIVIARLNKTIKSQKNQVTLPSEVELITYIQEQVDNLKNDYIIKFLDIPPCHINDCNNIIYDSNTPIFYFNDPNNEMQLRSYYKEVMIGTDCVNCKYHPACKTMKKTYLTLSLHHDIFTLERE